MRIIRTAVLKLCGQSSITPTWVFDQEKNGWFEWDGDHDKWVARGGSEEPKIEHVHFTGTGTRMLTAAARDAITALFTRSF